jgi:hypothetical protein
MSEIIPEFVYQKVGEGKGRPSKFVKEADGTLIPYKEWFAKQDAGKPKDGRGRKPYPRDEHGNIIRPQVNLEASTVKEKTSEPIKEIGFDGIVKVSQIGVSENWVGTGYNAFTINGTKVVIIPPQDPETNSNALMVWAGKIGREYKTLIDAKDLIRPKNCPAELNMFKFADETHKTVEIVETAEPVEPAEPEQEKTLLPELQF